MILYKLHPYLCIKENKMISAKYYTLPVAATVLVMVWILVLIMVK